MHAHTTVLHSLFYLLTYSSEVQHIVTFAAATHVCGADQPAAPLLHIRSTQATQVGRRQQTVSDKQCTVQSLFQRHPATA